VSTIAAAGKQTSFGLVSGVVLGFMLVIGIAAWGPAGVVVLAAMALGGFWLAGRPGAGLALLLTLVVVMEEDKSGYLPQTARFYQAIGPGDIFSPCDMILIALVVGFAWDRAARRKPIALPDPFTFPLLLMAAALASGIVMGWAHGSDPVNMFYVVRVFAYFLMLPVLVANLLDTPAKQRLFVIGAVALATYKGVEGTLAYAAGAGRAIEGTTLTFYEPTATWLLLLFLLGVIACRIMGARLPWWVLPAWLFAGAALVFSFRRSFWIAALLGVIVVVVLATGQHGLKRILPAVTAFAVAVLVAFTFVGSASSAGLPAPVLERARSLNPSSLQAVKSDRYRLTEQRNVIAEIRTHPLTGIGLGVPWESRYPLSASFPGSRGYTHVLLFNYWLKFGVLGVLAYLWLTAALLWGALQVWRSRAEPLIRASGLALFGGVLGLIVTDVTGSHTGVNLRLTIVFAAAMGWVSAVLMAQRKAGAQPNLD
jgi:hypothetical protein